MTFSDSVSPVKAEGWTGAVRVPMLPDNTQNSDDPSLPNGAYFQQMPAWEVMRAVLGGNHYFRAVAKDYIPKLPNESPECYDRRLSGNLFSPYTQRIVDAACGLILRKPIVLEGGDEEYWTEWRKNCDRQGTDLDEFARRLLQLSIGYGHASMLVDYPKTDNIVTLADEVAAKLTPYLGIVEPWDVLGWRQDARQDGGELQQVRLREVVVEPDGEFGESTQEQIRVLERGSYRLFRKDKSGEWVEVDSDKTSLDQIPLVTTYSDKKSVMTSEPPLLDVGYINICHYRLQSQHLNALAVAGFPILQLKGFDSNDQTIQLDVSKAIVFGSDAGAGASYVEPANSAFDAYQTELTELETQMSNLGISILAEQKRVAESGLSKQLDRADSNSMLAVISTDLEQCLQKAIDMAAEYAGKPAPQVAIARDFDSRRLDGSEVTAINTLFTSGLLDRETSLHLLHKGEVLDDSIDIDDVLSRAENEELHDLENEAKQTKELPKVRESTPPKKAE